MALGTSDVEGWLTRSYAGHGRRPMAGKMDKVMGEFKRGTLRSSSGQKVTSHDQAMAIALSEAREAGENVKPSPGERQQAQKRAIKRARGRT